MRVPARVARYATNATTTSDRATARTRGGPAPSSDDDGRDAEHDQERDAERPGRPRAARARQPGGEGRDRRDPARRDPGQPRHEHRRSAARRARAGTRSARTRWRTGRRARPAGSRRPRRPAATDRAAAARAGRRAAPRAAPRRAAPASAATSARTRSPAAPPARAGPPSRAPTGRTRSCAPATGRTTSRPITATHSNGMPRPGRESTSESSATPAIAAARMTLGSGVTRMTNPASATAAVPDAGQPRHPESRRRSRTRARR